MRKGRDAGGNMTGKADAKAGGRIPRYVEILDALRTDIASGRYPVEGSLPSESQLCARFEASRFTVREALRRLQADGMVARVQGAGSRVIRDAPAGVFVQSYRSVSELTRYATDIPLELLRMEEVVLDAQIAGRVGGRAGERWCFFRGLRRTKTGGEPLALIESYVPIRFAPQMRDLVATRGPIYAALEMASGERIVEAMQEIQALPAPYHVAEHLGAPAGSAALRILRRYSAESGTLIASFNWHHGGDRFIHRAEIALDGR
jgi:DNA-binding GntR family transcriptional regulator